MDTPTPSPDRDTPRVWSTPCRTTLCAPLPSLQPLSTERSHDARPPPTDSRRARVATALRNGWLVECPPGVLAVTGHPDSWEHRLTLATLAGGGHARCVASVRRTSPRARRVRARHSRRGVRRELSPTPAPRRHRRHDPPRRPSGVRARCRRASRQSELPGSPRTLADLGSVCTIRRGAPSPHRRASTRIQHPVDPSDRATLPSQWPSRDRATVAPPRRHTARGRGAGIVVRGASRRMPRGPCDPTSRHAVSDPRSRTVRSWPGSTWRSRPCVSASRRTAGDSISAPRPSRSTSNATLRQQRSDGSCSTSVGTPRSVRARSARSSAASSKPGSLTSARRCELRRRQSSDRAVEAPGSLTLSAPM